jgi:hypothetical protein
MPTTLQRVAQVYKSGSTDLAYPPLGWVGTLAAIKGDLVTLTAGVINPAVAVSSTIGNTTKLGILNDSCLATEIPTASVPVIKGLEKFDDDTLIELPIATSSGASLAAPVGVSTPSTTLPTLVGSQFQISRNSAGVYYVNQALTSNTHCEVVALGTRYSTGQAFSTVLVRIVAANRIS